MSIMYGVFTIPMILVQWCIDPLYHKLILNGERIENAEFCPVQLGFAALAGLCSFSVIYTFVIGQKTLKFQSSEKKNSSKNLEEPMLPVVPQ